MEIIVEIGNSEQKKLIADELGVFKSVVEEDNLPIKLLEIIVPSDFQSKINSLEGIDTYRAIRGLDNSINAIARIARLNDGYCIVLSPLLYTESHDALTRAFVCLHELSHVINKDRFPPISEASRVEHDYLHNLYFIYDEYSSDRFAYNIIDNAFPTKSPHWNQFIADENQGFIEILINGKYYEQIKREINSFREHADVELFLHNIHDYCDDVIISLAHTFSLQHQYPDKTLPSDYLKSPFINGKTLALMDFLRTKQEKHIFDLSDGIDLVTEFLTNFGMKFELINKQRIYCHVLDI